MGQKTEASQAVDLPFPPMPLPVAKSSVVGDLFDRFAMQQYAMRYADLVVAALKAQPAPTEAAQGNTSNNSSSSAQGEDSARLDAADLATIEEATKVLESAAKHNEGLGRTVFAHAQRDRAVRLRAILDRARARAETGGVSRSDLAKLLVDAEPGDAS